MGKFYFHPPGHSYPCQSRRRIHYLLPSVSAILGISILCMSGMLRVCVCVCVVNVGEFYSTCKDKKKRVEGQVYLQGIHFLPNEGENASGRHQTNSAY